MSVTVQLPPEQEEQKEYLTKYFSEEKIVVYWGDAEEFVGELKKRWMEFKNE